MSAKNIPCSVCDVPMWSGPTLADVPCCHTCRRRLSRSEKIALGILRPPLEAVCIYCAAAFLPRRGALGEFCSAPCASRWHAGIRRTSRSLSAQKLKRWQRDVSAPGLTLAERYTLLHQWMSDGVTCAYCSMSLADTIDHLTPLCRGGDNFVTNLVPSCRSCNSSKGSKLLSEWMPSLVDTHLKAESISRSLQLQLF